MAIEISNKIIADEDKLKYLYRMVELLRLEHNQKGKEFINGKIDEKEFRDYQKNDFELRSRKIFTEINQLKEKLDLTRNYGDVKNISLNIIEANKTKSDGIKFTDYDKDIDLTKI